MINRVLFYNSGGGIGDAIQIIPLINSLKNEFKNTNFYYLGSHENHFNSSLKDLNFQLRSKEAGLEGIKPYSINSGFIVWQGKQNCFNDALYLIKNILIDDEKGRNGDEYYLCAALQRCNTQIVPIDYDKVKIVKMWNGKISYKNKKLKSDLYSDKRDIFHYGNQNYNHPSIFRAMDELGIKREYIFFNLLNLYQAIRFSSLVRAIRKFYKNLVK